jgi:cardiolipin synthase
LKKQYLSCGDVELVHGGREYFDLLKKLIQSANETIHFQTYILSDDVTGNEIVDELIAAAGKGVKVKVLLDGFASQELSDEFISKIRQAGVQFRYFEPLFKSSNFYFGRRLHHKICVIDSKKAIVCGLNISDRYNDLPGQRAWFDMGIMVDGKPARELEQICTELWQKKRSLFRARRKNLYINNTGDCSLRICRNDWVMGDHAINDSYHQLFGNSKHSITIMCSYFLPGTSIRKKLRLAAKRGVAIKVVLAGLSDIWSVKYAERYLYRWMLRHKIEIYEYQPTVLHAKLAISDNELITIGSYNLNDLSANASIELNIEVKNKAFVSPVNDGIEQIIKNDCERIHPKEINIWSAKHFVQLLCYYFIRFILKLGTFYFRKKE